MLQTYLIDAYTQVLKYIGIIDIKRVTLISLSLLMLSSCTFFGGMDQSKSKVFDWENSGALDFLNYLCDYESNFYTVSSTYENWIKETDLPKLIERLDSSEPCANVAATSSSFIDKNRSTAGNEAAYLIMGYRSGKYPPNLNSTRPKPDIAEIKSWWNDQKSP